MGYGPADENRFGWCYRNEHGSGRRMTPYFETEEIVEDFHTFLEEHKNELSSNLPPQIESMMSMMYMGNPMDKRMDLRTTKLSEVNALAQRYAAENDNVKVTINPVAETMREFYGVDQENDIGYVDPTPFPWETNSESDENSDNQVNNEEENN